jgi:hypothetical protein
MTNEDIVNEYDLSDCPDEVKEQIRQSLINEEAEKNKNRTEQWKLIDMPHWGKQELIELIMLATFPFKRDLKKVSSAVISAQKLNELPEVFTPQEGIRWAQSHRYPFTSQTYELAGLTMELAQIQAKVDDGKDNQDSQGDMMSISILPPALTLEQKAILKELDGHLCIMDIASLRYPNDVGLRERYAHKMAEACL